MTRWTAERRSIEGGHLRRYAVTLNDEGECWTARGRRDPDIDKQAELAQDPLRGYAPAG